MIQEVKVKSNVKIDKSALENVGLFQKHNYIVGSFEDMEAAAKSSNADIRNVGLAFLKGDYIC